MTVGAASSALVLREQEQVQEQQVIPASLKRLIEVTDTSVPEVFKELARLAARLEASERQNREMATMYGAQLSANAQAIASLSDQVKVLGTLQSELAATREENAQLKQENAAVRARLKEIMHNITGFHSLRSYVGVPQEAILYSWQCQDWLTRLATESPQNL